MKVQAIVEGYGEVEAVPVLLRRLRDESKAYAVDAGRPIRRKRSEFLQEGPLRKAVRLALLRPDCDAILILLDADDDCPKELAPRLESWAKAEAPETPCAVVMACREYEAWFLATLESLRDKCGIRTDAVGLEEPEVPRGAKERLEGAMKAGRSYSATADQAPLTKAFDMPTAFRRCRSFRRMTAAFASLARGAGVVLSNWPPAAWRE